MCTCLQPCSFKSGMQVELHHMPWYSFKDPSEPVCLGLDPCACCLCCTCSNRKVSQVARSAASQLSKLRQHRLWQERESLATPQRQAAREVDAALGAWAGLLGAAGGLLCCAVQYELLNRWAAMWQKQAYDKENWGWHNPTRMLLLVMQC
jgi:hypothetical protein